MTDQVFVALRDLMVAAIVYFAYKAARDAKMSGPKAAWQGFLWCAGIALFAAISMGEPSCEESGDPIHGGCEQYADDGYEPTNDERAGRFLYYLTLLYLPVLVGSMDRKKQLVKQPERNI